MILKSMMFFYPYHSISIGNLQYRVSVGRKIFLLMVCMYVHTLICEVVQSTYVDIENREDRSKWVCLA